MTENNALYKRIGTIPVLCPGIFEGTGISAFTCLAQDWACSPKAEGPTGRIYDYMSEVMGGDEADRRKLEAQLAPLPLTWLELEHGALVADLADASPPGLSIMIPTRIYADAALISEPNQAVGLTTADCLPVVVAVPSVRAAVLVHAGWRGLAANIIEIACDRLADYCAKHTGFSGRTACDHRGTDTMGGTPRDFHRDTDAMGGTFRDFHRGTDTMGGIPRDFHRDTDAMGGTPRDFHRDTDAIGGTPRDFHRDTDATDDTPRGCHCDTDATGNTLRAWRHTASGTVPPPGIGNSILPEDAIAWIGPCISGPDYEVGAEVRDALLKTSHVAADCFAPSYPERFFADLKAIAAAKLYGKGILSGHLEVFHGSTLRDHRFHSVRRDGAETGRIATVLSLEAVRFDERQNDVHI